ncbi:MAG: MBL fold metallo-hydrolase [Muribaculaceae bacterium]|nr:MBL fold metallo-hydrolase [Muribaculaceae bacterium]
MPGDLAVSRFVNSVFSSNTYVVSNGTDAVVIDPGDFAPLQAYLGHHRLVVRTILLTHTHYDHIYGLPAMMEAWPEAVVLTSEFGKAALTRDDWNFSRYHCDPIRIESDRIRVLRDGDEFSPVAGCHMTAVATPGHDKSCLVFRTDRWLFTGDSYIPGVKVVASFPNSDRKEAQKWYEILRKISHEYQTFPGHGDMCGN